jgi:hypothetical protein
VDVLTNAAPAESASAHATRFSSSVNAAVSRITLTGIPGTARTTASMSAATIVAQPLLSAPKFCTMSISAAPSVTASSAACAFTSGRSLPCGKPMTLTTLALVPASDCAARVTQQGCTQ